MRKLSALLVKKMMSLSNGAFDNYHLKKMKHLPIIIITGLSGSGKSSAVDSFEDAGFFCVDNMPVALLPKFLELSSNDNQGKSGFVFVMDLREKGFLSTFSSIFDDL